MRIFVSAGEPSGDIHGANLIRELKARRPDVDIVGFGGERMAAAGAKLYFPLVGLAVMGVIRVITNAVTFIKLILLANRRLREDKPDAVILIDYPGFHWWVARRAKAHGIPVYYFCAPQLWAWAGWRIHKMRRLVDRVLCVLPFEDEYYRERGLDTRYVGHPFFDELPRQQLDREFLAEQANKPGEIIALLPGSRTQEVEKNFDMMAATASRLHAAHPSVRFLVAAFKASHRDMIEEKLKSHPDLPIEVHLRRTPEILESCRAVLSVSGSVALEILYRGKPTVILYKVSRFNLWLAKHFITTPYICLVNLIAGKIVYPEYLTSEDESAAIAERLRTWLTDEAANREITGELERLRKRFAEPGACGRAADAILETIGTPATRAA